MSLPVTRSERIEAVLDRVAAVECEFLPVVLLNHEGKATAEGHTIVNPLRTADLMDTM